MKKRALLKILIFMFILTSFLIILVHSQTTPSTPAGTPAPAVGGNIDPDTGLPNEVLPIAKAGDIISDNDKRTAYLKAEWEKILLKSATFGPAVRFLLRLDPVSKFLLGIPINFSWYFFLTLVIFIDLLISMFRATWFFRINKATHYIIYMALCILVIYFKIPKGIAASIVGIIALLSQWWMQYVIIAIVILAAIVATYFSKQLKIIAISMKEHNKKTMEELDRRKLKSDLRVADALREGLSSI